MAVWCGACYSDPGSRALFCVTGQKACLFMRAKAVGDCTSSVEIAPCFSMFNQATGEMCVFFSVGVLGAFLRYFLSIAAGG